MLEAQGLGKSYGSRKVVADLSLRVAAGETVGLLGPNGAGKSTTVAMLCGLVGADQGRVWVGTGASRRELTENTPEAKRRIGVVPQELSIYENLGAAANLESVRRALRPRRRLAARARRRGAAAGRSGRSRQGQAVASSAAA